ncbi:hypothetical protein C8J57DRAFT_1504879 [Mycena rebaudengoi]|nr:hypothetical protein C8J57DRAFT_1504879 [Mycena rebaudengoi]
MQLVTNVPGTKRASPAYMFFCKDWHEKIKTENSDASFNRPTPRRPVEGARRRREEAYIEQAAKDKIRAEDEKAVYEAAKKSAAANGNGDQDNW